jgi:glycosyltransferase involved in cell wall biosynthesis
VEEAHPGTIKLPVRKYCKSLPSLRDNSPLTLVEAMAAQCLPIVLATGGPGETVSSDCGIRIPLSWPGKTVEAISDSLALIWQNEALSKKLSFEAVERVKTGFLSSRIPKILSEAYLSACG